MRTKNISQIAQERIIKENIKPISRTVFSFKRVLFWTLVFSSIIIGAISFAIILNALLDNDWYLFGVYGLNFVFKTLPYFWFMSLLIFMIVGDYYYRQTLLGYRKSLIFIIVVYLSSTIVLGSLFYWVGVGMYIEKSIENNMPSYRGIILNRHQFWSHPEDGLLSGEIIRIKEGELEIMDFDGLMWVIDTSQSKIYDDSRIEIGERVKILGKIKMGLIFKATEIRSWLNLDK